MHVKTGTNPWRANEHVKNASPLLKQHCPFDVIYYLKTNVIGMKTFVLCPAYQRSSCCNFHRRGTTAPCWKCNFQCRIRKTACSLRRCVNLPSCNGHFGRMTGMVAIVSDMYGYLAAA